MDAGLLSISFCGTEVSLPVQEPRISKAELASADPLILQTYINIFSVYSCDPYCLLLGIFVADTANILTNLIGQKLHLREKRRAQ